MIVEAGEEYFGSRMSELIGRTLSSIEFVQDYVQLRFDGPCLTAFIWPRVEAGHGWRGIDDQGYRDDLCSLIGTELKSIQPIPEAIEFLFQTGTVRLSLREADYRGPEAFMYQSSDGGMTVA